jgi:hypothetical protein
MARTLAQLPAGSRITDYISLGVIAKFFPAEQIHEVLAQTQRASLRERDLPAQVVGSIMSSRWRCICALPIGKYCGACWQACRGCSIPQPR